MVRPRDFLGWCSESDNSLSCSDYSQLIRFAMVRPVARQLTIQRTKKMNSYAPIANSISKVWLDFWFEGKKESPLWELSTDEAADIAADWMKGLIEEKHAEEPDHESIEHLQLITYCWDRIAGEIAKEKPEKGFVRIWVREGDELVEQFG